jgi:hypothetical protein
LDQFQLTGLEVREPDGIAVRVDALHSNEWSRSGWIVLVNDDAYVTHSGGSHDTSGAVEVTIRADEPGHPNLVEFTELTHGSRPAA